MGLSSIFFELLMLSFEDKFLNEDDDPDGEF